MGMVKARIDMDDGFTWSPTTKNCGIFRFDQTETMEIDEALVNEFNSLVDKWYNLQWKLEQLYRVQEGLVPWVQPEIPEHVRLIGGKDGT